MGETVAVGLVRTVEVSSPNADLGWVAKTFQK